VLNRSAFEEDPEAFVDAALPEMFALRKKVVEARDRLKNVNVPREIKVRGEEQMRVLILVSSFFAL
jgi:Mg-chelatase subunit ChlI